jgi:hypothetical protein
MKLLLSTTPGSIIMPSVPVSALTIILLFTIYFSYTSDNSLT